MRRTESNKKKLSTERIAGIFLLIVFSWILSFQFEYAALAIWPAIVAQFSVLWRNDVEPTLDGYKRMNKTSLITYGYSFAINLLVFSLVLIYRGDVNIGSLLTAVLASVAYEAILLTVLIPFVLTHSDEKRWISWALYGILSAILGSLSEIWLSASILQGIFDVVVCPLIIIGSIIYYKHFSKQC